MSAPLRLVIVEDDRTEAESLVRCLKDAGFAPDWQLVTTPEEFLSTVDSSVDVILSAYTLARFNALAALNLLQTRDLDVPLIVVADTGDESTVVECMRLGAVDYLLKDRLARLGDAIRNALEIRQLRREKRDAAATLHRMNRAYRALSDCNQAVVRATDEMELLEHICQILVDVGGYRMVWVGYVGDDAEKLVHLQAWAGHHDGYLEEVRISWADDEYGQGPAGRSIRLKQTVAARFIATDPEFAPWREAALARGYQSAISLPLVIDDRVIGILVLYSERPNAFDAAEISLLEELAGDLAFGIAALRTRLAREEALAALRDREERLRKAQHVARMGFLDWDLKTNLIYWSEEVYRLYGIDPEEGVQTIESTVGLVHPDDFEYVQENLDLAVRGLKPYNIDHRMVRPDGRVIWVHAQAELAYDEEGQPVQLLGTVVDITARKEVEEALRQSEEKYRLLAETARDIILVHDMNGTITYVNEAGLQFAGYSGEDMVGRSLFDFLPPESVDAIRERATRRQAGDTGRLIYEAEFVNRDGVRIPLEVSSSPIIKAGQIEGILLVARDISARKEAERALRESEERNRVLFEGIDDAIFVHDEEANILDVNEAACRRLGYTREELLRMKTTDIDAPDYAAGFKARWAQQVAEGGMSQIGGVHIARDGREIIIDVNTRLINYKGKPAVLAVVRDVTERHRIQEAEHRQRQLAEALSEAARVLNSTLELDDVLDSILVAVGQVLPYDAVNIMVLEEGRLRIVRHRGYEERGLKGWIESIDWPLDKIENLREMAEEGRPEAIPSVQAYSEWVDVPETRWVRSYVGAPIRVEGEVIGFLNLDSGTDGQYAQEHADQLQVFADHAAIAIRNARLYEAVQRHAAELEQAVADRTRELRQSEALYRAIVEDHPDLVCRYDPDGTLTFVNAAYAQYFGKTPEELVGQSFMPFIPPDDRLALEAQLALLSPERPVVETEHRVYTPSGDIRWLQWTNRMVLDDNGRLVALQAVGRDVTERRQFEESLQKALAREVELGELKSRFVSMVSHEFRNPLAVMQTNVDLLRRYSDRLTPEQRQKQLNNLQSFIHRMSDLLDDVLTVSRAESGRLELQPERFDLLALCQEIVEEVQTTAPPALRFHIEADGECRITADPKLIRQAVGNLISNAAKYSRPTGVVRVSLRGQPDSIEVEVADQGIGIPKPDQVRLFEGFHRASNVGKIPGTGLGLMIARLCVERHGGSITFESEENVGSTFTLAIPRAPARSRPKKPPINDPTREW